MMRRVGKRGALFRAVLSVLLLPVGFVGGQGRTLAAGATAYGEQFVRLGVDWPEGGPGFANLTRSGEGDATRLAYQRQVAARELEGGPYTDALAEPLAAMAAYHRAEGEFEQAVKLYRRALHVVRVNDGLYSERQIPVLRELLKTFRAAGDLETLDQRYDYFFRLYGGGEPPYTEVRMRAALEYLRWQREAVRLDLGEGESKRLLELYDLNDALLQAAGQSPDVEPSWYRKLGLSQLRNLYLIQDRLAPRVDKVGLAPSTPMFVSEWTEEDVNTHRLESVQRGAVGRGERLLQDLMAREPDDAVEQHARLLLELGDWLQWNGRDERAAEQYAAAGELLRTSGRGETLREWFGQPVELPDNGAFWQPVADAESSRRVVVSTTYDVSARGRVRNIEASAVDEEDADVVGSLRRKLARTRFRPRFINGEPEPVEGITRKYEFFE